MNVLALAAAYLAFGWCWLAIEFRASQREQRAQSRMTPLHIGATWLLWPAQLVVAIITIVVTLGVASAQRVGGGSRP